MEGVEKERGERHFLFPMQEIRAKTQNGGPHLLELERTSSSKIIGLVV
jgi:hypothetical protein